VPGIKAVIVAVVAPLLHANTPVAGEVKVIEPSLPVEPTTVPAIVGGVVFVITATEVAAVQPFVPITVTE
jgi:hypothetical protein